MYIMYIISISCICNTELNKCQARQRLLNFVQKHNAAQIVKAMLTKKNKTGEIMLPGFKLYYKATVIKRVWCWHKNIQVYGIGENFQKNTCIHGHLIYGHLIYDKRGKNIQWEKGKKRQQPFQ